MRDGFGTSAEQIANEISAQVGGADFEFSTAGTKDHPSAGDYKSSSHTADLSRVRTASVFQYNITYRYKPAASNFRIIIIIIMRTNYCARHVFVYCRYSIILLLLSS